MYELEKYFAYLRMFVPFKPSSIIRHVGGRWPTRSRIDLLSKQRTPDLEKDAYLDMDVLKN